MLGWIWEVKFPIRMKRLTVIVDLQVDLTSSVIKSQCSLDSSNLISICVSRLAGDEEVS